MEEIKNKIRALMRKAGVAGDIDLIFPPNAAMGDLGFAVFGVAKEQGNNPFEAARFLKAKLEENGIPEFVERIEAVGPYLNFFIKIPELAKAVIGSIQKTKNKYGSRNFGKGKKVLIEYPANNTHKEMHVGHLRNICLGNALSAIFSANGYKVIPVNYINDFGAHVARCLWGLNRFHKNEKPPENKQKWLGEIYAEASAYLDKHPEEKEEVKNLQKKLEARDKSIWPLYQETRKWSLEKFEEYFKELHVSHAAVFYEQEIKDAGQKVVDELLKKKIAVIGEGGAIIVDLKKYGLDIALLRKSDGAGLYLTSDLGLALAKQKKYPGQTESVHITGDEQNFYFQQLFKLLELAGYKFKMTHIGYGLVNLPGGKMSSREGSVVSYEDLRNRVLEKVVQETAARHKDWSGKKINDISHTIAFSAIKFDFLKHEANKVIIFDAETSVSFNGFTGPYILYVIARINSLLKKSGAKIKHADYNLLDNQEEKNLLLLLSQYEDAVKKSFENYNPSVITKYCFDLAKQFNDFYNKHSILNAGNEELIKARLMLSQAVKQVLENALALLTIDITPEM
jgi:arginyl-tRNA synthetase